MKAAIVLAAVVYARYNAPTQQPEPEQPAVDSSGAA